MKYLPNKFKARSQIYDDKYFASKKELSRYLELQRLKEVGEILFFIQQTPLHLPGKIKYVCDFVVFWANGEITFEDVKGFKTDTYKLKKKLVEYHYPIEIMEI